ncbi:MAG: hypothetical protein HY401_07480 [Elusimicrobia bacterium]|nr:hypothetical protein [Elusimicrobiota bacterium]
MSGLKAIPKEVNQGKALALERSFFNQQPRLKLPALALAGSPWQVSLRFEELKAAQQYAISTA